MVTRTQPGPSPWEKQPIGSVDITKLTDPTARAIYVAELLYVRMETEGVPESEQAAAARIQLEIDESGWTNTINVEDVRAQLRDITTETDHVGGGPLYVNALRQNLRAQFGVNIPDSPFATEAQGALADDEDESECFF